MFMSQFDGRNLKISIPVFIALLVVAQIDLASAFAWPGAFLALLHLSPAPNDLCRGVCAGIGVSIDLLVLFQLARVAVRHAIEANNDEQDA